MDLGEDKGVGRFALTPGPLVHIFSITVHPKKEHKPFAIYGKINAEFRDSVYGGMVSVDIYNRQRDDAELLDAFGALTLNGLKFSIHPDEAFIPMFRAKIYVKLFDGADNIFVQESFTLDDIEMGGCNEQVKSMSIGSQQGSLTIRYVAIPLGIHCRVEVLFCNRPNYVKQGPLNVNGNITARFLHTYGNYNAEDCLLFLKHPSEFERVEVDGEMMQLTRSWVTLPAYSSLSIAFDLSEFQTRQKIVNETVEFLAQPGMLFGKTLMLDNMFILVRVAWFPPKALGPLGNKTLPSLQEIPIEESDEMDSDIEGEDESLPSLQEIPIEESDEMDTDIEGEDEFSSNEESSSNLGITWDTHNNKPASSPAMEIFSVVVIGQDSSKEIEIHGSIKLLSDGNKICNIFKRDANDAFRLTQDMRSSLILDGSRKYDDDSTLELKFDMKDIDNHIVIKGFKEWDESKLNYRSDQQLCCFVQGNNGFAAVHYSIFPRAVAAVIKISVNLKAGLDLDLGCRIYGTLISQYNNFDYSSRYNKDYYRVVLFHRSRDKAIQLNQDGSIPLSRSMLVVPSYSSLVINLNLSIGTSGLNNLSYLEEIEIGEDCKIIETNELLLRIHVDWCEIK